MNSKENVKLVAAECSAGAAELHGVRQLSWSNCVLRLEPTVSGSARGRQKSHTLKRNPIVSLQLKFDAARDGLALHTAAQRAGRGVVWVPCGVSYSATAAYIAQCARQNSIPQAELTIIIVFLK